MAPRLLDYGSMSINPYTLSSIAMNREASRLECIAENLANGRTPGFKATCLQGTGFAESLNNAKNRSVASDFEAATLKSTTDPLDFAIKGKGFFVVEKDGNEFFTRNGSFKAAPNGTLMNQNNMKVMGESGTITIPAEIGSKNITIDSERNLMAGERRIGRLRVVDFSDYNELKKVGSTLFAKTSDLRPEEATDCQVLNRTLEGSNSQAFQEMADLITCMRSYESTAKWLKSYDAAQGKLIQILT